MRSAARRLTNGVAIGCALILTASACGGSSGHAAATKALSPTALLAKSKTVLNDTPSFHFALASSGIPSSASTAIVSGSGDLVRPDRLKGSFDVQDRGIEASVGVIVLGNAVYAQLPFSSGYTKTDPSKLGIGNPADLISPTSGVSSILTALQSPVSKGEMRISGQLVQVVSGTLPGRLVPVLPDANRSKTVAVTAAIDPSTDQLRQIKLVGPFVSASASTTYTVTLTDYGEHVTVTAPS